MCFRAKENLSSCIIFSCHVSLVSLQPRMAPSLYLSRHWHFWILWDGHFIACPLVWICLMFYSYAFGQDVTAMKLCSFLCIAWGGMGCRSPHYSEVTLMFGEGVFGMTDAIISHPHTNWVTVGSNISSKAVRVLNSGETSLKAEEGKE